MYKNGPQNPVLIIKAQILSRTFRRGFRFVSVLQGVLGVRGYEYFHSTYHSKRRPYVLGIPLCVNLSEYAWQECRLRFAAVGCGVDGDLDTTKTSKYL